MNANEELLPCPFCGGSQQRVKSSGRWGWFVSCSCAAACRRTHARADGLTPEQAVAATLGLCNCSNSERTETCHDKGTFKSWGFFTCSNCSVVIPLDAVKDAPSIGRTLPPKYCPNCGRKVVDPTTNDVDAEVTA